MVLIPTGANHTATATGSVIKKVRCEHCSVEYVYRMERKVTGRGYSPIFLDNDGASDRAQDSARQKLGEEIDKGTDIVPCPSCGWLQNNMVRKLKKQWILITLLVWPVTLQRATLSHAAPARMVRRRECCHDLVDIHLYEIALHGTRGVLTKG